MTNLSCYEFSVPCFLQYCDGKSYINCYGNDNVKLENEKFKERQ